MTQHDYDAYSNRIANEPVDKPFLCGGYTQADWNILNGDLFDREWYDDYCETPQDRAYYIECITKPYLA